MAKTSGDKVGDTKQAKAVLEPNQSVQCSDKLCFVVSPIGEDDSETRKRADQVLRHIIRPAVEPKGYTAVRADEIDKPGIITSQVIQHIVTDQLVIADLTERNPNVFYELAIRHALRKPYIQIIKKGDRIPFDVAGTRTIQFDHTDLDSVDAARRSIADQIDSLEQDPDDIESPITVSVDLQRLRQSDDPEERSIGDILEAMSSVQQAIIKIDNKLSDKDSPDNIEILHEIRRIRDVVRHGDMQNPFGLVAESSDFTYSVIEQMADYAGGEEADEIRILMYSTIFKPIAPWVYEAGIAAYQAFSTGAKPTIIRASLDRFDALARSSVHGPWVVFDSDKRRSRRRFYRELESVAIEIERVVVKLKSKYSR